MRFMILATLAMGGCLQEGSRPVFDTSSDTGPEPDVTETTDGSSDGAGEIDGMVDTRDADADLCSSVRCDDGDPCTFDRCNPETGECEFLGTPGMPPECASNPDCEDGDTCTGNTCIFGECGGSFCLSEVIEGCSDCASGCDDQNACTQDVCRGGEFCDHVVQEGCLPQCVGEPLYTVSDVVTGISGVADLVRATGLLTFDALNRSCDDGPECGCSGTAALADDGLQLALRPGTNSEPAEAWTCESRGCQVVNEACRPAFPGVRYRIWGRGLYEWELGGAPGDADAIAPLPGYAGIAANTFCLETTGTALVGSYAGSIVVGGAEITFDATINAMATGVLRLSYRNASCTQCPADITLRAGETQITTGNGWIEFDALLPSMIGDRDERVRLFSNRNALTGMYGQTDNGLTPFIALPPGGRMTLQRRP